MCNYTESLPLLLYPQALDESGRDPSQCKALLAGNDWVGAWVDGVFSYHHYHSNAHEVLCVIDGSARLAFGGPHGETLEVEAGDVVVIPAGVGHKNEGSSGRFTVIGAYPRGQENYDLRTGEEDERPEVLEKAAPGPTRERHRRSARAKAQEVLGCPLDGQGSGVVFPG